NMISTTRTIFPLATAVIMLLTLYAGMASAQGLNIEKSVFGTAPDGQTVDMYTLTNRRGMQVNLITFGARIQAIKVPDKNGQLVDVALGFKKLDGYLENNPYMGATIGRYANRIAGGKFKLDGKTFSLAQNDGPNNLHGGPDGFYVKNWQA